jgi:formyl-CoA transferase
VIGTMMALYARDRSTRGTGRGQHVDVSMVDPILQLLALPLANYVDGEPPPARLGSRVAGGVPRNLYRASDGDYLALSGTTDAQVERILGLVGRDSDEDRARFGTSASRLAAADELDGIVATWIAARAREEVLAAFHGIRIPVAPVNDLAAILEDPHVRDRASVTTLSDAVLGEVRMVTPTPRLSENPGHHSHTGPSLGAHNEAVLRDWLGLDSAAVAVLARDAVI